jgi:PKD repeat protein
MTISCSSNATTIEPDSQVWTMGGAGSFVAGGDTFSTAEYTYDLPGTYTVRLTVTGRDGSTTFDERTVTVPGA